jgi:two-component system NtrC family response regulator
MATAIAPSPSLRTILVVEGRPDVSRSLNRILAGEPTKILSVSTGARALQLARHTRLDLVIVDMKLPDLGGTEVLRRLRGIDRGVPVIMVTSHGSAITVRAAMELGAADYLTKPFDDDEMKGMIHEALASRPAGFLRVGAQHGA